jgi:hypothetical protein
VKGAGGRCVSNRGFKGPVLRPPLAKSSC